NSASPHSSETSPASHAERTSSPAPSRAIATGSSIHRSYGGKASRALTPPTAQHSSATGHGVGSNSSRGREVRRRDPVAAAVAVTPRPDHEGGPAGGRGGSGPPPRCAVRAGCPGRRPSAAG